MLRGVVVSSHRTEVVCDVYEARGDDLPMASLLGEELPIAALTYNGHEWRGSLENLDRAALAALERECRRSGAAASTHRRRVAE